MFACLRYTATLHTDAGQKNDHNEHYGPLFFLLCLDTFFPQSKTRITWFHVCLPRVYLDAGTLDTDGGTKIDGNIIYGPVPFVAALEIPSPPAKSCSKTAIALVHVEHRRSKKRLQCKLWIFLSFCPSRKSPHQERMCGAKTPLHLPMLNGFEKLFFRPYVHRF